jgi:hypothetical protein
VEELMKQIEKFNAELTKLKTKKIRRMSPQVKMTITHMKRMPPIKQRKTRKSMISPPIMLYLLTTITCLAPRLILPYPLARLLILMEQTIINESIA